MDLLYHEILKNGNEYYIYDLINDITSKSSNNITISGGDGLTYQIEKTYKLIKELKLKHNKNAKYKK